MRQRLARLLLLCLALTAACSGVPTAPSELIALGNVRNTGEYVLKG